MLASAHVDASNECYSGIGETVDLRLGLRWHIRLQGCSTLTRKNARLQFFAYFALRSAVASSSADHGRLREADTSTCGRHTRDPMRATLDRAIEFVCRFACKGICKCDDFQP